MRLVDDDTGSKTEVVLVSRESTPFRTQYAVATQETARSVSQPSKISRDIQAMLGVQVIELAQAYGEVVGEFPIQAAAERHSESSLAVAWKRKVAGTSYGRAGEAEMVAAEQGMYKWGEVLSRIQAALSSIKQRRAALVETAQFLSAIMISMGG